jgi:hypothetical protein
MFDSSRISGPNAHPRTTQWMHLFDILGDGKGADVPRTMPLRPKTEEVVSLSGGAE